MRLIFIKILNTMIIVLFFCACSSLQGKYLADHNPTGTLLSDTNAHWDSLIYNKQYRVVNNVWNKNAATGPYTQRVFLEKINGIDGFGWQWDWVNQSRMVVAYPEVIFGDKPWDVPSGIEYPLPIKAGSSKITADFDINIRADGVYNMAFTLWCVSSLPQQINNISHEIMIWPLANGIKPAGKKYSTILINNVKYDIYVKKGHTNDSGGSNNSWLYIAFIAEEKIGNGLLTISDFTDYLIKQNLLSKENYITSIELGNEIVSGSGCTEIKKYQVSITKN